MYFPASSPKLLSLSTASVPQPPPSHSHNHPSPFAPPQSARLPNVGEEGRNEILQIDLSPKGDRWVSLTAEEVCVWKVRPAVVLAKLKRSSSSLRTYGPNVEMVWKPDGRAIAVLTSTHHILFFTLLPLSTITSHQSSHSRGTSLSLSLSGTASLSSSPNPQYHPNYTGGGSGGGSRDSNSIVYRTPAHSSTFHPGPGEGGEEVEGIVLKGEGGNYYVSNDNSEGGGGNGDEEKRSGGTINGSVAGGIGRRGVGTDTEKRPGLTRTTSHNSAGAGMGFGLGLGEGVGCICSTPSHLLISILNPPSIRCLAWPTSSSTSTSTNSQSHSHSASRNLSLSLPMNSPLPPSLNSPLSPTTPKALTGFSGLSVNLLNAGGGPGGKTVEVEMLDRWEWLLDRDATITSLSFSRSLSLYFLLTSDGRAYVARKIARARQSRARRGSRDQGPTSNAREQGHRAKQESNSSNLTVMAGGRRRDLENEDDKSGEGMDDEEGKSYSGGETEEEGDDQEEEEEGRPYTDDENEDDTVEDEERDENGEPIAEWRWIGKCFYGNDFTSNEDVDGESISLHSGFLSSEDGNSDLGVGNKIKPGYGMNGFGGKHNHYGSNGVFEFAEEGDYDEEAEEEEEEEISRARKRRRRIRRDRKGAVTLAVNPKFSTVAVGLEDGTIVHYSFSSAAQSYSKPRLASVHPSISQFAEFLPVIIFSHESSVRKALNSTLTALETSTVECLSWTSDGYALAVGWRKGWGIWSVFGRLAYWSVNGLASGVEGNDLILDNLQDHYMGGVKNMFWAAANLELTVLCPPPLAPKNRAAHDEQIFSIPFCKSAVTGLHSPDNTKHAFLQMDDRVLVYRGADQPDMSVINPEADVWQHIKIPANYISSNWPIRYACISSDARTIAVAGKRGFTHYNALTGRWKLFENLAQENSFCVRGGMQWYANGTIFVVATDEGGQYAIRLFARDQPLNTKNVLCYEPLPSPVLLTCIFDDSLLVYTADNTFFHFLFVPARDGVVRLRLCGSIGFEGVVSHPSKVRGMSWLVPKSQQRLGDPADDLNVATVIFLIDGHLVLLRPRKAIDEEVKYDMQVLGDQIEFYWTHLSGIGTLENSLWGWDGKRIRVWLDALTIEEVKVDEEMDAYQTVRESFGLPLDFYPLSLLMEKGIVIGVDSETSIRRSLDFCIFKITTNTHLFLQHVLQFHLQRGQIQEAVIFASHYRHLVYFAHALEILLHTVLEDEADARPSSGSVTASNLRGLVDFAISPLGDSGHRRNLVPSESGSVSAESVEMSGTGMTLSFEAPSNPVLPRVIEFLDHFDEALQVVVGVARKTEVARWWMLFDAVGKPQDLFEKCLSAGLLKVAASYLLVLHTLEPMEHSSNDTIRLFKAAISSGDWTLCKELLRFLYSLDQTGLILETALEEADALPPGYTPRPKPPPSPSAPQTSLRPPSPPSPAPGRRVASESDAETRHAQPEQGQQTNQPMSEEDTAVTPTVATVPSIESNRPDIPQMKLENVEDLSTPTTALVSDTDNDVPRLSIPSPGIPRSPSLPSGFQFSSSSPSSPAPMAGGSNSSNRGNMGSPGLNPGLGLGALMTRVGLSSQSPPPNFMRTMYSGSNDGGGGSRSTNTARRGSSGYLPSATGSPSKNLGRESAATMDETTATDGRPRPRTRKGNGDGDGDAGRAGNFRDSDPSTEGDDSGEGSIDESVGSGSVDG